MSWTILILTTNCDTSDIYNHNFQFNYVKKNLLHVLGLLGIINQSFPFLTATQFNITKPILLNYTTFHFMLIFLAQRMCLFSWRLFLSQRGRLLTHFSLHFHFIKFPILTAFFINLLLTQATCVFHSFQHSIHFLPWETFWLTFLSFSLYEFLHLCFTYHSSFATCAIQFMETPFSFLKEETFWLTFSFFFLSLRRRLFLSWRRRLFDSLFPSFSSIEVLHFNFFLLHSSFKSSFPFPFHFLNFSSEIAGLHFIWAHVLPQPWSEVIGSEYYVLCTRFYILCTFI